jgi:large subunit ribosomal protein L10
MMFADKGNAPAKLIKDFRKKIQPNVVPALKSAWIDEAVFIGDDQLAMLPPSKARKSSSARSSACCKARSRT